MKSGVDPAPRRGRDDPGDPGRRALSRTGRRGSPGLEMEWPAALVNVYEESENAKVTGKGAIDGNGKLLVAQVLGRGRQERHAQGPYREQAACAGRSTTTASAFARSRSTTRRTSRSATSACCAPGFWSVTVTYSEKVVVDGVKIRANIGGFGPSSDGVDIDSSKRRAGPELRHRLQR